MTPATDTPLAEAAPAPPKPRLRGWLHFGAFVVWLPIGAVLITNAPTASARFILVVYVVSIALLFGVSAAFHLITWQPAARRRMRRADHATIFIAIAGQYTAVVGLSLHGITRTVMLAVVWAGAIVGIVLREVWLDAPKWAIAIPYVVVGWSALAVLPQLLHVLGGEGIALMVAGGLAYTAGAVVYAARKPNPWPEVFGYHEVFHALTIVGTALNLLVIAYFALPLAG